jgi:DNA-directed RNA polymerase II subunit RPB11
MLRLLDTRVGLLSLVLEFQPLTCALVPHPLFATFELRVQTDGVVSPKEALVNCCKALVGDLEILSREFTKEYELRKMVSGDAAATENK